MKHLHHEQRLYLNLHRRKHFAFVFGCYLHMFTKMASNDFPVSCERMTRGMKRLLEKSEMLASTHGKKDDRVVNIEVRRCNGKKYVRVFRTPNKGQADGVDEQSSETNVKTSTEASNPVLEKTRDLVGETNEVSTLLSKILHQIKNKFASVTQNEAKTLPGSDDKDLGISL